jgi:glycosyltransferase involved in cell wall biosynthesis
MSAALPTVAPAICGNAEAIQHDKTGYLYQPGDMQGAVAYIEMLLENPGKRSTMGSLAKGVVEKQFNLSIMNEQFVCLIASLL